VEEHAEFINPEHTATLALAKRFGLRLDNTDKYAPGTHPGREVMRFRHFSPRTEEAYVHWIRRFILWSGKRHPQEMGATEVRAFLTDLAARLKVSASTQNQALNALVFLYRAVVKRDLEEIGEIEPAKRGIRMPTVLSREEIKAVLTQLTGTQKLIGQMLYGTGLRLLEGLVAVLLGFLLLLGIERGNDRRAPFHARGGDGLGVRRLARAGPGALRVPDG
jgi:integrase